MRIILAIFVAFTISLPSASSQNTAAQFYHTHKHKEGVTNFKMPGWAIWLGGGIAQGFVQDEATRASLRLARKVKKIRFMTTEGGNPISAAEVGAFVSNIRQAGYEDLIFVRQEGTTVNIIGREKKEKLKNLIIMVNEEDEFVYMDMKSRMKAEDLTDFVNTILNAKDKQEEQPLPEEEESEESESEPVVAKKAPRA